MFAGQFHNEDTEVHAWSEVEGVGRYRWLQGPMNHLPREQQLEFIADAMLQNLHLLAFVLINDSNASRRPRS